MADYLRMAARAYLTIIPSVDKALHDLGTSTFIALHLFSVDRIHLSAVAEFLCLIERLEELHTKVQGIISSPYLATTLMYNVSRRWIQYLNRYMDASALEVVEAPGDSVPFSLKPILVDLEGGRYVVPILPRPLEELLTVK